MSFKEGLRKLAFLNDKANQGNDSYDMNDLLIRDEKVDLENGKLNYLLFEFDRDVGYGRYEKVY